MIYKIPYVNKTADSVLAVSNNSDKEIEFRVNKYSANGTFYPGSIYTLSVGNTMLVRPDLIEEVNQLEVIATGCLGLSLVIEAVPEPTSAIMCDLPIAVPVYILPEGELKLQDLLANEHNQKWLTKRASFLIPYFDLEEGVLVLTNYSDETLFAHITKEASIDSPYSGRSTYSVEVIPPHCIVVHQEPAEGSIGCVKVVLKSSAQQWQSEVVQGLVSVLGISYRTCLVESV